MSNVVAVTIGIGEQYRFYAEKAAEEVRKMCGIEVRIVGDEHLPLAHKIDTGNVDDLKHRTWTLKYRIFDIWPDLDEVMYFDCDWRPVRPFDIAKEFGALLSGHEIALCHDRYNDHCEELRKLYGLPFTYHNAGFFLTNKNGMAKVAKPFFDNYNRLPKKWGDQCVLNQILNFTDWTTLPKKFNIQDLYDQAHPSEVVGYHSGTNYKFFEGSLEDFKWNQSVQDELAGIEGLAHGWSTSLQHLMELHYTAKKKRYGKALEIGTFKGHGAAAIARACMNLDTVDTNIEHSFANRQAITDNGRWPIEFIDGVGYNFLWDCGKIGKRYDFIFHDSEHGSKIIPELSLAFELVLADNGIMMVHDVDALDLTELLTAISPKHYTITTDAKGRQMGTFYK